jgi:hypothetical protein
MPGAKRTETAVTDTILLTIPTTPDSLRGVAGLVLGGVGTRVGLPFERMDDLQLAVLSLLDAVDGDEATIEVDVDDEQVAVTVGPLRQGADVDGGVRLVLRPLTDRVDTAVRDGRPWLTVSLARAGEPRAS